MGQVVTKFVEQVGTLSICVFTDRRTDGQTERDGQMTFSP